MSANATAVRLDSESGAARTRAGKVRLRTLGDIDARTAAFRRFQELVGSYSSDLGGDPSTAQSAIIRRAVSLQVWLEDAEASYAHSGKLDIATYSTATNTLRRLLTDIGLERQAKEVETLEGYLAHRNAGQVAA